LKHIAGTAANAALQLREFLLHGPAQQQGTHQHAGAVAGTVTDGSVSYVYGEITGYYLHWLASLREPAEPVSARALAAAQWLERYLQGQTMPATRIYLEAAADDWRNNALFAFDLAMIAGGLARAQAQGLLKSSAELANLLLGWLEQFVDGDRIRPCIVRDKTVVLPSRWSTQGGSFSAKTASRILLLSRQVNVDTPLLNACSTTLSTYAAAASQNGLDMLHPTLYAIEGCLLATEADYEKLARWFDQIVALQAPDGSLPESLETPDVRRTDIIAQALRVAVFLQQLTGHPFRYQEASQKFAVALCSRVRKDGSIGFTAGSADGANIWSAMFAEQALRLYAADVLGQPLPFTVEDLV
jgi:hypothetical protein